MRCNAHLQHLPRRGCSGRLLDTLDECVFPTCDADAVPGRIDRGAAEESMSAPVERRLIVAMRGDPSRYPFLRIVFSKDSTVLKTLTSLAADVSTYRSMPVLFAISTPAAFVSKRSFSRSSLLPTRILTRFGRHSSSRSLFT